MFRTRSLSLMYCVNLAETSHTRQSTVNDVWVGNWVGGSQPPPLNFGWGG